MLAAFLVLLLATLTGFGLIAPRLAGSSWWPHWSLPALHGALGATGLALIILRLSQASSSHASHGGFGRLAAILFASALAIGLLFLARIRRGYSLLLAIHACLAITALVALAAYQAG